MSELAIPDALLPFAGRIVDVDTHEQVPAQLWVQEFGEVARQWADFFIDGPHDGGANHPSQPGTTGDDRPIAADTVWTTKGPVAAGAIDPHRRMEVMDLTGVRRQQMFPTAMGGLGSFLYTYPPESRLFLRFEGDRRAYARKLFDANNDWMARRALFSDRLQPVAVVCGDTVDELIRVTEAVIARGVRSVLLLSSIPPGGVSPAHTDLDPFYALLTRNGVVMNLHVGIEGGLLASHAWGNAPAFEGYKVASEFSADLWNLSVMHLAPQNFTATMIVGGVFERHPDLVLGLHEVGSHWIGPMADMLDHLTRNAKSFGNTKAPTLSMTPSDYIRRNIRVAPFSFEPVDVYIERHGFEDVFCYSSDYPHVEGGKDPMAKFYATLERLGPAVLEKFFVRNGEALFGRANAC
jgi:predicted TIM-barrel fold metal-dependent hydrolase